MKPYYFVPGVPAAGHISRGYWHPGRIDGCPKCERRPHEGVNAKEVRMVNKGETQNGECAAGSKQSGWSELFGVKLNVTRWQLM